MVKRPEEVLKDRLNKEIFNGLNTLLSKIPIIGKKLADTQFVEKIVEITQEYVEAKIDEAYDHQHQWDGWD